MLDEKKDIKSVINQALKNNTSKTFAKEDKKLSRRTVAKAFSNQYCWW